MLTSSSWRRAAATALVSATCPLLLVASPAHATPTPALAYQANGTTAGKMKAADTAVVFVHGMNDKATAFEKMEEGFKKAGWNEGDLFAWDYEGWRDSNVTNADRFISAVEKKFGKTRKIAIVAHSLGSVPTRYALVTDPKFRDRVVSWTSLGGPNLGPGQSFVKGTLLDGACSPTAIGLIAKNVAKDYVTTSTCQLTQYGGGFMERLNDKNPTPAPTDYEEITSSSDDTVDNAVTNLPINPNNHHWHVDGVSHQDLPRNDAVIKHVINRIEYGTPAEDVPWRPVVGYPKVRHQGQFTYLTSISGTADDRAKTVLLRLPARNIEKDVSVTNGHWSFDFGPSFRVANGTPIIVTETVNGKQSEWRGYV